VVADVHNVNIDWLNECVEEVDVIVTEVENVRDCVSDDVTVKSTEMDISRCVSFGKSLRKDNTGHNIIGLDTQASGSITNDRNLIGNIDLTRCYQISGWNGKCGDTATREPSYGGMNKWFGKIIYNKDATMTLISYWDLILKFDIVWSKNGKVCTATHKQLKSMVIEFGYKESSDKKSRVLVADISPLYRDICGEQNDLKVNALTTEESKELRKDEYARALEVLRFHSFVHPGDKAMEEFVSKGCLLDIPFVIGDCRNAVQVRDGECSACALGKATRKSRVRKCSETTPSRTLPLPPLIERVETTNLRKEILGFDCFFIDGIRFLISVGKHVGLINVVQLINGTKPVVGKAMLEVIKAYQRNRMEVMTAISLSGTALDDDDDGETGASSHGVGEITSDSEAAIVNSGLEMLAVHGIRVCPKSAGEHVGFVERPIRTIKERVACIRTCIAYEMTDLFLGYMVVYVTNWLNLMTKTERGSSAYIRSTCRKLSYKDLTRARFGDFVVATRVEKVITANGLQGEAGVCLGPSLNSPGSIYFYSLTTKEVKLRHRFEVLTNIDGVELFGVNKHALPVTKYARLVSTYNTTLFRVQSSELGGGSIYSPMAVAGVSNTSDSEESNLPIEGISTTHMETPYSGVSRGDKKMASMGSSHIGNGITESNMEGYRTSQRTNGSMQKEYDESSMAYMQKNIGSPLKLENAFKKVEWKSPISTQHDMAGTSSIEVKAPVTKAVVLPVVLPLVTQKEQRTSGRTRSTVNYRELNGNRDRKDRALAEIGITEDVVVNQMNLSEGVKIYGQRAHDAMVSELKQIVIDYEVAKPSHLDFSDVTYMRAHDLINQKLDDTVKARYVIGKQVGNGTPIDWGIDTYSPTIDMKLLIMMLSLCLEEKLELDIWDVKGAFLKADMIKSGIYMKAQPHIAKMILDLRPDWLDYRKADGSL
jgi:hypothetical protein